jgi:hypothetical protein
MSKTQVLTQKKTKMPVTLRRYQGPLLPGGEWNVSDVKQGGQSWQFLQRKPRRRRRKRRNNRNNDIKQGPGAPVSYSSSAVFNETFFKSRPIYKKGHGQGTCVTFNTFFCQVGSNGVTANMDNLLPVTLAGMWSSNVNWLSGLITVSGSNCSGWFVHPITLGGRMFSESFNWTEWQPKRLKLTFQTSAATTAAGQLMFGFNRDPTNVFECSASAYLPNTSNMSQNTPLAVTSLYRDASITISDFDPTKFYKVTTYQRLKNTSLSTTTGDLSYIMEESCGRFAGLFYSVAVSATPYGSFWISGEVEFYGPTYGFTVSATTITDGTSYPMPLPPTLRVTKSDTEAKSNVPSSNLKTTSSLSPSTEPRSMEWDTL